MSDKSRLVQRGRFPQHTFPLALPMSYVDAEGKNYSVSATTSSISSSKILFRHEGLLPVPKICTIKIGWPAKLDGSVNLKFCAHVNMEPSVDGFTVAHIRRWWMTTAGGNN